MKRSQTIADQRKAEIVKKVLKNCKVRIEIDRTHMIIRYDRKSKKVSGEMLFARECVGYEAKASASEGVRELLAAFHSAATGNTPLPAISASAEMVEFAEIDTELFNELEASMQRELKAQKRTQPKKLQLVKKPAAAKTKKIAKASAAPGFTPGAKLDIEHPFGLTSAAALARWMGADGWSKNQAISAYTNLGLKIKPKTIARMTLFGARNDERRGPIPTLENTIATYVRSFRVVEHDPKAIEF